MACLINDKLVDFSFCGRVMPFGYANTTRYLKGVTCQTCLVLLDKALEVGDAAIESEFVIFVDSDAIERHCIRPSQYEWFELMRWRIEQRLRSNIASNARRVTITDEFEDGQ